MYLTYPEPERKNQIAPIDLDTKELRKRINNKMKGKKTLRRLWDYCLVNQSNIRQLLPWYKMRGSTEMENVTSTVISETTVQHVTRDDTPNTKTAAQVEIFNTDINEQLDDTTFRIQHIEGGIILEGEYALKQCDPAYR